MPFIRSLHPRFVALALAALVATVAIAVEATSGRAQVAGLVKGATQREILDLLAAGATTTQIADRLGLSPKTVRNHLSSTFTKIEALDRTQAVLKARAAGLPRARER